MTAERYLSGKLLIAMPDLADTQFERSVVLMLIHTDKDAMGVVVNKIAGSIHAVHVSEEGVPDEKAFRSMVLHDGGPVDREFLTVIHPGDGSEYPTTQVINKDFCMTTTPDIVEDLSRGEGPEKCLLVLSYSGWAGGQLEDEIERNSWLICDASPQLVFGTEPDLMWEAAVRSLGVSPEMLTASGGSA